MIINIFLFAVIIGLLVFMRDQFRAHERALQMMADRVQAPTRIPLRDASSDYVIPERTPDEWNQVGTIEIDDKYGLEDEAVSG